MLQQTRVETVIPYYERFLERFPTVDVLASADEEDVLREWAGLGYYARARNLKRAAEHIVRDHGSMVPEDARQLGALPGIGRYTVGAIRSIAFRKPAALVDGNVNRVLSRLFAEPHFTDAALWGLAEALVSPSSPHEFNQGLMELGATVCVPRKPACERCPLTGQCEARQMDRPEDFPASKPKPPPKEVQAVSGILSRGGTRWLMLRRPSKGLLGGLWEVPSMEGDNPKALLAQLEERTGLRASIKSELGTLRHIFTHRALTLRVLELQAEGGRLKRSADARWVDAHELSELPLSRLIQKTLKLADVHPSR